MGWGWLGGWPRSAGVSGGRCCVCYILQEHIEQACGIFGERVLAPREAGASPFIICMIQSGGVGRTGFVCFWELWWGALRWSGAALAEQEIRSQGVISVQAGARGMHTGWKGMERLLLLWH